MSTRVERAKQRSHKALKIGMIFLVLLILVLSSATYIYASNLLGKETIYEGVTIKEVEVGNLTKEEARQKLESVHKQKLKETELSLVYGDYKKSVNYGEIGAEHDYDYSVEKAYEVGREGSFFARLKEILDARKNGVALDIEFMRDDKKLDSIIAEVEKDLNREPENADISYSNGATSVEASVDGQTVDTKKLKDGIVKGIGSSEEVKIPVEVKEPDITTSDLEGISKEIGSYTTSFSSSDANRNYNILLSSNSIDGKIVMPGEVFSFNDATGLRDRANGYRESIVIVNKKPVPGVGGGVCQTSSTLYNAVAKTGVEIVERHNHSLPVGYVPAGKDATVADYSLDFRFRNSFDYPIFIKSDITGNSVTVRVYGK
jgi:vancomycin resistance protein YoaR